MPNDILLDDNGDLLIKDGHFVIGESTGQHKKILLLAEKGDIRQYPFVGVGIQNSLEDDELADLGTQIQKQFELDGMKVRKIEVFEDGTIKENASYD